MAKKISDKKILKEINNLGKSLSSNNLYVIHDNMIISSGVDKNKETLGIHFVNFIGNNASIYEDYSHRIKNIDGCNNGSELSKVINGTGFVAEYKDDETILSSNVSISGKKEKQPIDWSNMEISNIDNKNKIINDYFKYLINYNRSEVYSSYQFNNDEIEELLNKKKFILDMSDKLNVKLLLLTNKTIKNLNKNTKSLVIEIREIKDIIGIKLCHILVANDNSETHSLYAFLD